MRNKYPAEVRFIHADQISLFNFIVLRKNNRHSRHASQARHFKSMGTYGFPKLNYIFDISWTFKSKLQTIRPANSIHHFFLTLINIFFISLVPSIHICLYYFLILCSYFHSLFLTILSTRHILQFKMFDLISLQPAQSITEIKDAS